MSEQSKTENLLGKLQEKYESAGQDLNAYLEGLLYSDFVNYWDYVSVDTLLTLQKPRTDIPDEMIFIVYHQITELYFKLTLHEIHQLTNSVQTLEAKEWIMRLNRMNAYFRNLTHSFEIMIQGMDKDQFLKFRMSLLPASGFQSAQYRLIEICSTDLAQLSGNRNANEFNEHAPLEELYNTIYWKSGATELATGKKTLTLTQFEQKYAATFLETAQAFKNKNMRRLYAALPEPIRNNTELISALRDYDTHVNVKWPLVHYKSAVRYLQQAPDDIAATGGTNWQKYLPPRFQKRIFFPELWSDVEIEEWGKAGLID